jgi:hypothetical protein
MKPNQRYPPLHINQTSRQMSDLYRGSLVWNWTQNWLSQF